MMTIETFEEVVRDRIMDYLPPIYHKFEVKSETIDKVNGSRRGIILKPPKGESGISPVFYTDGLYEQFRKNQDMDAILTMMANTIMVYQTDRVLQKTFELDKYYEEMTLPILANKELNEELLPNVPNRDFADMAIVYRLILDTNENEVRSVIVGNEMMERSGISEEELNRAAMRNLLSDGMRVTQIDSDAYFVTNNSQMFGANLMLSGEFLEALSRDYYDGGDFSIIAPSIDSFVIFPDLSEKTADEAREQVAIVVATLGRIADPPTIEDFLTKSLYRYIADEKRITIVR